MSYTCRIFLAPILMHTQPGHGWSLINDPLLRGRLGFWVGSMLAYAMTDEKDEWTMTVALTGALTPTWREKA
ncbi:hypothetical protein LY76DRAFT_426063 [Colletotrichum caudatum]|nr:hypothetical protein LY76DRAFT_426063 [Colletotrichum caudatum]